MEIMKTRVVSKLAFLVLAPMIIVSGCANRELYGKAVTEKNVISISDILVNADTYKGKMVKVEGEIVTECPTGCWFEMGDGSAVLYVDIGPNGIAIPQRVGKNVTVQGVVVVDGYKIKLIGEGVEIK